MSTDKRIHHLATRFSSKIKTVYVELHNYTFFHSPEGVKKSYSRYVGREKLKEKLKSILTNSESKSGAYLVTGFRGMGKTSLVRKAIAETKGNYYYASSRHFRQFLLLTLIYLLYSRVPPFQHQFNHWIIGTAFFLCVGGLAYLVFHDKNRPNLWRYYDRKYILHYLGWIYEFLKSVARIFDAEMDYYKRSRFKELLQDIIIITLLFLISMKIISAFKTDETEFSLLRDIGIIALTVMGYFLIVFVNNNFQLELLSDNKKRRIKGFFTSFLRIFGNAVKRLDYGNKVPIEISLSQDDLKEVDILKLLSKNIYSEYKSLRNKILAPNRLILPILQIVGIYIVVSLLYYYNPIYSFINDFRSSSLITDYLPSQTLFPYLKVNQHCQKCLKDRNDQLE
ncbi:MAG: ATP-binding protein, partial [Cyclobacteriaceae bacterium]